MTNITMKIIRQIDAMDNYTPEINWDNKWMDMIKGASYTRKTSRTYRKLEKKDISLEEETK